MALTWAHRDRMQQTVYLVTQSGEPNIGPRGGDHLYTVPHLPAERLGSKKPDGTDHDVPDLYDHRRSHG